MNMPVLTDEDYLAIGLNPPAREKETVGGAITKQARQVKQAIKENRTTVVFAAGVLFGWALSTLSHLVR